MTFLQRKQKLIDRLENTFDEDILDRIEEIFNEQDGIEAERPYVEDGVLHFSPELKGRIDLALEQMRNGQAYTEEEMDQFFDEWLLPPNVKD